MNDEIMQSNECSQHQIAYLLHHSIIQKSRYTKRAYYVPVEQFHGNVT